MANFNALASLTAALRARLLAVLQTDAPGADVTMLRPADVAGGMPAIGVNIFLYQVHPSAAQRNLDLPSRRSDGTVAQRPQLAVDCDFLLSFFGDKELAAQRLLGSTMRSLYARPVITPAMIDAVDGQDDAPISGLADQEMVRLTPIDLSIEEMSKLWSIFFQTPYALSVAYRASTVLIEAALDAKPAPPVLDRALVVTTLRQPVIAGIARADDPDAPITPAAPLVVTGQRFTSDLSRVLIEGDAVSPTSLTDTRITLTLPSGLLAGPQTLQVRHDVAMGQQPTPRPGLTSSLAAFVLHPVIDKTGPGVFSIAITDRVVASGQVSATITVTVQPAVDPGQTATLELIDPASNAITSLPAAARTASTGTLAFVISAATPGPYLARVRVDGAESGIVTDTDPASPTNGQLVPRVTL